MNNSINKFIFIAALILGAAYYFYRDNPPPANEDAETLQTASNSNPSNTLADDLKASKQSAEGIKTAPKSAFIPKVIKTTELDEFKSLKTEEKKSLLILTSLLEKAVNGEETMDQLVEELDDLKLKPVIMKDENPYTGSMNVVRTKETLPGTRYVHAQYFANKDGTKFLQHISFELRASENSFEATKKAIQKQFNISSTPVQNLSNFISWHVANRTIWIKKLEAEDMKDVPFNSYDKALDKGTVRVAIEAEIHQ